MSGEDRAGGADDLTELYRAASARDPARPGEAVRQAILAHARTLANQAPKRSNRHIGVAASLIVGGLASLLAWRARPPIPAAVHSPEQAMQSSRSQQYAANAPAASRPAEPPTAGLTHGAALPRSSPARPAPLPAETGAAKETAADLGAQRARVPMAAPRANLQAAPAAAPPARLEARSSASSSALVAAAEAGDRARVEQLLRGGASTEQTDARGRTALLVATSRGDVPLVRLLLAAGARSDVADSDGDTPLAAAQRQGSPALLRLLEGAPP